MNKNVFMNELAKYLYDLPEWERNDILLDYEEHFSIGFESGRSEEEIANALGNPKVLAKQIKSNYANIQKSNNNYSNNNSTNNNNYNNYNNYNGYDNNSYNSNPCYNSYRKNTNIVSKFIITCGLFFLNVMVVPLLVALGGVVISLFAASISLSISGLAALLSPAIHSFAPTFVSLGGLSYSTCVFLGITIIGLGALCTIGCVSLSKAFIKLIRKYFKWNMNVIRGEL